MIRYYKTYFDDFVTSRDQSYKLPPDYTWVCEHAGHRVLSALIYRLGEAAAFFYCRFILHVQIKNRKILRKYRGMGCFIYGNHTQPAGDAWIPIRAVFPRRGYAVVSPANLKVPVLGPLLPYLGALPVPDGTDGMKKFQQAIRQRILEKCCIVLYPEAHVWPWCTRIRPFGTASFTYPVRYKVPSFCMTTTYQKRRHHKKPKVTVYIDGPFYPDGQMQYKEQKKGLRDEIYQCMLRRSRENTCTYVIYEQETKQKKS